MKKMLYVYSNFRRPLLLILILFCAWQIAAIYLFNFGLTKNEDRQLLSGIGVVWSFIALFMLPFLAFKYELSYKNGHEIFPPWQFGFIINLPVTCLLLPLGLVDLAIKVFIKHDVYWVLHWRSYLTSSVFGFILYLAVGGLASWLASRKNNVERKK